MDKYRDRTNIKWKTAFMLPEHIEGIKKLQEDQGNVPKPLIDEQKLDELSRKITDSLNHNLEVEVTYWFDQRIRSVSGNIVNVDTLNKKLVIGSSRAVKIPFDLLIDIN